MNTRQKGNIGEDKATSYLEKNGYQIICRNFRVRGGEIDIVARKDDILVFVEVKRLPSGNVETLEKELSQKKQNKIVNTAKLFIAKNKEYGKGAIRFDVIVVDMPGFKEIYHIENAFV